MGKVGAIVRLLCGYCMAVVRLLHGRCSPLPRTCLSIRIYSTCDVSAKKLLRESGPALNNHSTCAASDVDVIDLTDASGDEWQNVEELCNHMEIQYEDYQPPHPQVPKRL